VLPISTAQGASEANIPTPIPFARHIGRTSLSKSRADRFHCPWLLISDLQLLFRQYVLDNKLSKTVGPSILVGLSNDPSRGIRYTKVQDLSGPHNIVQGEHNLLDGRRVIPPVDVEDINVIGLQLDQGGFERVLEGFLVVTAIVDLDTGEFAFLVVDVWGGVLAARQSGASWYRVGRTWLGRSRLGSFSWPSNHR
jgi:hypothetical protein